MDKVISLASYKPVVLKKKKKLSETQEIVAKLIAVLLHGDPHNGGYIRGMIDSEFHSIHSRGGPKES